MTKTIVVGVALAISASLLGGCSAGIAGGSMLPASQSAAMRSMSAGGNSIIRPQYRGIQRNADSGGGGPIRAADSGGGGPIRAADSGGGGPIRAADSGGGGPIRAADSGGGGPIRAADSGGGGPIRNLDSGGGGPIRNLDSGGGGPIRNLDSGGGGPIRAGLKKRSKPADSTGAGPIVGKSH